MRRRGLRTPGTGRSGDYTAAKLQCLATHNAGHGDGHGNNVGINGAVTFPADEIIGVRGVLIFMLIDFHILPPTHLPRVPRERVAEGCAHSPAGENTLPADLVIRVRGGDTFVARGGGGKLSHSRRALFRTLAARLQTTVPNRQTRASLRSLISASFITRRRIQDESRRKRDL